MSASQIAVQADPKFSGSGSDISAEDWLLQLQNSAIAQGKTGKEAIAYYRAHLLGPARSRLGVQGEDFRRADWARADTDEALWASTFRQAYFKATTQAESVTDWAKIKQGPEEGAGDLCSRVGDAVRSFWAAVNGERPGEVGTLGSAATHRASANATEVINVATAEVIHKIERLALARVSADSLRGNLIVVKDRIRRNAGEEVKLTDAQKLQMYENLDVDMEEDNKSTVEMREEINKVIKQDLNPVHMQQHYDDLKESTSRVLTLRTLQAAFSNPKCKEEAFTFLKHPEKDMADFKIAIKQAESATEARALSNSGRQPFNRRRNRVNAVHSEDAEEGAEDVAQDVSYPDPAHDPAFAEYVAAFYNKKKGKPASNAHNKGNGSSQEANTNRNKGKICDHCGFKGHVVKECNLKKAAAARKKAANVAASQQPAEN